MMTIAELKKQHHLNYSGRFICPICGQHKTHSRLYGYRCDNFEHYEQEQEFTWLLINLLRNHAITQEDYDAWCAEGFTA
jgi:hypothetical protein